MAMTLADLFVELAHYSESSNEHMLAHLCRMAALEAQNKAIPAPLLDWHRLGTWDWDAANDVMFLDEECAKLFNVEAAVAKKGLPISDYIKAIHSDDAARVGDAIMKTLKNGGPYECRYRVNSNGRIRSVVARGACTLDAAGRAVRFIGVILEIPSNTARLSGTT